MMRYERATDKKQIKAKNPEDLVFRIFQSVKELSICPRFWYNKGNGGVFMEQWRKDARREAIIVDLEALVPQ
ncbi:MAG: hypothetical protein IJX37_03100, partial [Oscillospiraceae bacterium]|nr:hypothetical protein [Oscillospiraceae bacterium]